MTHIENYKALVETYKNKLGRLEEKEALLKKLSQELVDSENSLILYTDALEVMDAASQFYQKKIFDQIDRLVTEALQVICEDESISVKTELVMRRGQPEAYFLYKDGVSPEYGDLLYTHGGGIVDIISCALRLIVAELMGADGPIIFDEPIRMLHSNEAGYEENFIKFIREFSHRRNRQIIIITHSEELMGIADKSFKVVKDRYKVSQLKGEE